MLDHQFTNRHTAQVHEGFGLGQQNLFAINFRPSRQRTALAISHFHAAIVGDAINGQKSQIVRRELVFHTRIAQPDNQFHAASIRLAISSTWGQPPRLSSRAKLDSCEPSTRNHVELRSTGRVEDPSPHSRCHRPATSFLSSRPFRASRLLRPLRLRHPACPS